jgi:hypothetical protein
LEHETDVARRGAELGDVGTAEHDLAAGRHLEPRDHAKRGRFAAPRRPEQNDELALFDIEVEPLHGPRSIGVRFLEIPNAKKAHASFGSGKR